MIDIPNVGRPDVSSGRTWGESLKRLKELQEFKKEDELWVDKVEYPIDTRGFPYFIWRPLSDMHLGAQGCDMVSVTRHLDAIKSLPIYTHLLGDMGDLVSPDEQLATLRAFFEEYQEKILGTVQDPSHTDWIRQASGIEPQRWLVKDLHIPMIKSGGEVEFNVNGIKYKVLVFHKIGRFNSSLNITNAGKRMLDMRADADAVVSGHTHIGAMEKVVKRENKAYIVNLGTFKTHDQFGERQGLVPRPQVFSPTFFFDGRRKNIEVIEDDQSANEMIESIADYVKKNAQATLGLANYQFPHTNE